MPFCTRITRGRRRNPFLAPERFGLPDLAALLEQRRPLVLDTKDSGKSIAGAVGLPGAGVGGTTSDDTRIACSRSCSNSRVAIGRFPS